MVLFFKSVVLIILVACLFGSQVLAQSGNSGFGMFNNYQLYVGMKTSKLQYDIRQSEHRGMDYVSCTEAASGELCGYYGSNANFGHEQDSENGFDYSIELGSPYTFFGESIFGYQMIYEIERINYNSLEIGDSDSPFPMNLFVDKKKSETKYDLLEENVDARLEGYFLSWTPVLFMSLLKGSNYLLKLGFGLGLGYLKVSGGWDDGYIKTYMTQTAEEEDYLNQTNRFNFDFEGLIKTWKIEVEFSLYSVRLAMGFGKHDAFSVADPLGNIERKYNYAALKFVHYL